MHFIRYCVAIICIGTLIGCGKDNADPDLAGTINGTYQVYAYRLGQDSLSLPTPPTSSIVSGTSSYNVNSTLSFTKVANTQSTINFQFLAVKRTVVNGAEFTITTTSNQTGTVNLSSGSGSDIIISTSSGQLGTGTSQGVVLTTNTSNGTLRVYARK